MASAFDRLNTSVSRLIGDVATELRNHPAAQNDDGKLNGLADQLDQASTSLEANNQDPAPVDPAPTPGDEPQPTA